MTNRKPDALKQLCGTARPDRREPECDVSSSEVVEKLPRPPRGLDPDGADLWRELGRELVAEGRLTALDLVTLELLCMGWSRLRRLGDGAKGSDFATFQRLLAHFGRTSQPTAAPRRRKWSPY